MEKGKVDVAWEGESDKPRKKESVTCKEDFEVIKLHKNIIGYEHISSDGLD